MDEIEEQMKQERDQDMYRLVKEIIAGRRSEGLHVHPASIAAEATAEEAMRAEKCACLILGIPYKEEPTIRNILEAAVRLLGAVKELPK